MALTNFGLLTEEQKTVWSRDMWSQARTTSAFNKFLGEGENAVVQHIKELTKSEKGDRAVITLVADAKGDGVAGDRTLEGREEALSSYDQVIRIDKLRHAHKSQGEMAEQRSVVNFRKAAKGSLSYWLGNRIDQMFFLTLAGVSYAYTNNGVLRTSKMDGNTALADLEFAADIKAPSAKRRARWNKTTGQLIWGGATSDVTAADVVTWEMLVQLKAEAKLKHIRGVREKGGEETYHVFLNPTAMAALKLDPDYMNNLRHAQARDGNNPLFTGSTVKIDGLYIHEHEYVYNTLGAASGSKWGGGGLVDGCSVALCGAQALGFADIGDSSWVEKEFDYDAQPGIAVGKILGFLKPRFATMYEDDTVEDFGVINVFTAARKPAV